TTESPEPVAPIELRSFPRYPILQRCLVVPGNAPAGAEGWRCIAYNISRAGIGLTLPAPLRIGAELIITPWQLPAAPVVRARVVHSSRVDFLWFCGCEFLTPLSADEHFAWTTGRHDWLPKDRDFHAGMARPW